jgi:hypothetical protein
MNERTNCAFVHVYTETSPPILSLVHCPNWTRATTLPHSGTCKETVVVIVVVDDVATECVMARYLKQALRYRTRVVVF